MSAHTIGGSGGHSAGGANRVVFTDSAGTGTTDSADFSFSASTRILTVKASSTNDGEIFAEGFGAGAAVRFGRINTRVSGSAWAWMTSYGTTSPGNRNGIALNNWSEIYNLSNTFGMMIGTAGATRLLLHTNDDIRLECDGAGNVIIGEAAIATTATDGFLYVPTCAGTPTGVPTAKTGRAPIVVDSTNHKLYFYDGSWRDAGP